MRPELQRRAEEAKRRVGDAEVKNDAWCRAGGVARPIDGPFLIKKSCYIARNSMHDK
jgi:hypothetical protein